ncbi:tyrosine-type recombinase/integrase [Sinorhizobium fredii]|nr:tyrosine-type recombinase/integrase [Sinorhizobium fredii]
MLDIARSYPSPRAALRQENMYTMLLLAYCAGLRRGELARLDLGDVNLGDGTITVRQTKFFKTRILPLPDSVVVSFGPISLHGVGSAHSRLLTPPCSGTNKAVPAPRQEGSPGCLQTSYVVPG